MLKVLLMMVMMRFPCLLGLLGIHLTIVSPLPLSLSVFAEFNVPCDLWLGTFPVFLSEFRKRHLLSLPENLVQDIYASHEFNILLKRILLLLHS